MKFRNEDCSAPLAVLPGLICDSRMFSGLMVGFPGTVCVDGFYGGADSFEAMARYALDRIPERVTLLGHSMGGRVALEIVRRAPGRVARLVLSSTGVHPLSPGEAEKRHALSAIGRGQGFAALVDTWLPPMLSEPARADAALYERLRAMCLGAGQAIFDAQIAALLGRPEVESLLPVIRCPTLVITGEHDGWSPPAQHRAIAAAIPGAQLRVVAGAGHMLPAEMPETFNSILTEWLGQASLPEDVS